MQQMARYLVNVKASIDLKRISRDDDLDVAEPFPDTLKFEGQLQEIKSTDGSDRHYNYARSIKSTGSYGKQKQNVKLNDAPRKCCGKKNIKKDVNNEPDGCCFKKKKKNYSLTKKIEGDTHSRSKLKPNSFKSKTSSTYDSQTGDDFPNKQQSKKSLGNHKKTMHSIADDMQKDSFNDPRTKNAWKNYRQTENALTNDLQTDDLLDYNLLTINVLDENLQPGNKPINSSRIKNNQSEIIHRLRSRMKTKMSDEDYTLSRGVDSNSFPQSVFDDESTIHNSKDKPRIKFCGIFQKIKDNSDKLLTCRPKQVTSPIILNQHVSMDSDGVVAEVITPFSTKQNIKFLSTVSPSMFLQSTDSEISIQEPAVELKRMKPISQFTNYDMATSNKPSFQTGVSNITKEFSKVNSINLRSNNDADLPMPSQTFEWPENPLPNYTQICAPTRDNKQSFDWSSVPNLTQNDTNPQPIHTNSLYDNKHQFSSIQSKDPNIDQRNGRMSYKACKQQKPPMPCLYSDSLTEENQHPNKHMKNQFSLNEPKKACYRPGSRGVFPIGWTLLPIPIFANQSKANVKPCHCQTLK